MSSYLGSIYTYHGGSCTNAGFRRLNYNGQTLRITSGWNEECTCLLGICAGCTHWYRDYERCTWAIHAPGARQISIKVTEMDVSLYPKNEINLYLELYIFSYPMEIECKSTLV